MVLSKENRHAVPAHYIVKIESFSAVSNTSIEKYESGTFEVAGKKWRLCVYPKGRNVKDHIALTLKIVDTDILPGGWKVDVNLKMFVFDKKKDMYLTIQESDGSTVRFHDGNEEIGFDQALSLDTFRNDNNGYLVKDSCTFGVEVFVVESFGKGETMSLIKNPLDGVFPWKVPDFASLDGEQMWSDDFQVEGHKWKLSLYPNGYQRGKGRNIALFLHLKDPSTLPMGRDLYVEFKLRVKNRHAKQTVEKGDKVWFSTSSLESGFIDFMPIDDILQEYSGFIQKKDLNVEVEIEVLSKFHYLP